MRLEKVAASQSYCPLGPGGQPKAEGDLTVNWEMLWIILARIVFQKGDALDFFLDI